MKAFVITPFKSDQDFETKRELILNLAKSENIDIVFASHNNAEINEDSSLLSLESSDFVIADLSYERPSCYFEVGFAQATNKKIFLIALLNTVIHQVKSKSKVKFYSNLESYKEIIIEILRKPKL